MSRTCAAFAFLIIFLSACAAPQASSSTISPSATTTFTPTALQTPELRLTVTPNPTEYAQATLSANATNNAVHYETSVVGMTGTASFLEKHTATPSPMPALRSQDPSFEELGVFLRRNFDYYTNKEGKVIWTGVEKYFSDVNGDGTNELILVAEPEIFILYWTGVEYQKMFEFFGGASPRGFTNSQASFADWTNDSIPEVIFDIKKLGGGTEYDEKTVDRWIIHCQIMSCNVVWEGTPKYQSHLYGIAAELYSLSSEFAPILDNSQPAIRITTTRFNLDDFTLSSSDNHEPGKVVLFVRPVEIQTWVWDGNIFNLAQEESQGQSSTSENLSQLSATSSSNSVTNLHVTDPQLPYAHDYCQVLVGEEVISPSFPCAGNFSQIQWLDITGDGVEEILATMLFAYIYEYEMFDTMIPWCAYQQRIVAYQQTEDAFREIANSIGCVTAPDLYGVRLEDYNNDGLPEIFASSDEWNTSDLIYKWDGTYFVLSDEICVNIFPGYTNKCRRAN